MKNDFDPQKAFVAEDGYEYEDLADYLVGKKVEGGRFDYVHSAVRYYTPRHDANGLHAQLWAIYRYYNRDGDAYAGGHARDTYSVTPGAERFAPKPEGRDAAGTRCSSPEQAAPDPIYSAN